MAEQSEDPRNSIDAMLRHVGNKLGLKYASIGEIVYEAAMRFDVRVPIVIPPTSKPQLSNLELLVLENAAKVLLPKGGHTDGYQTIVSKTTGLKRSQINTAIRGVIKNFLAANIEQAIVCALTAGVLDFRSLFKGGFPRPLLAIGSAIMATGYKAVEPLVVELSKREKEILTAYARLMGENGGLYSHRLTDALNFGRLAEHSHSKSPVHSLESIIRYVGKKYGLKNPAVGEVIYEAVNRGDIRIAIRVPIPANPQLTESEQLVLEETAKYIVPKGGNIKGYRNKVGTALKLTKSEVDESVIKLIRKFNAANIEQALVMAFAAGILEPDKLFKNKLPIPLEVIMDTNSYQHAEIAATGGVYAISLTDAEKEIAINFINQMGANGGLFWHGWQQKVSRATGRTTGSVTYILENMRQTFNASTLGSMFYNASKLIGTPVVVKIPRKVDVNISEVELKVMSEVARTLLSSGGYYWGYLDDVSRRANYSKSNMATVTHSIVERTGTRNVGQAVTYMVGHGIIPVEVLITDQEKTPALEAIVEAMQKMRRRGYTTLSPLTQQSSLN